MNRLIDWLILLWFFYDSEETLGCYQMPLCLCALIHSQSQTVSDHLSLDWHLSFLWSFFETYSCTNDNKLIRLFFFLIWYSLCYGLSSVCLWFSQSKRPRVCCVCVWVCVCVVSMGSGQSLIFCLEREGQRNPIPQPAISLLLSLPLASSWPGSLPSPLPLSSDSSPQTATWHAHTHAPKHTHMTIVVSELNTPGPSIQLLSHLLFMSVEMMKNAWVYQWMNVKWKGGWGGVCTVLTAWISLSRTRVVLGASFTEGSC